MRLKRGVQPKKNFKYGTKKLADYDTRQKNEDEIERNLQINDLESIQVMRSNIQNRIRTAANNITRRACKKPKGQWISEEVLHPFLLDFYQNPSQNGA